MDVASATAVIVGVPQVLAAFGEEETRNWPPPTSVGSVSLIETLVRGLAERFVNVILIVETAPSAKGPAGVKLFVAVTTGETTEPAVELTPLPLQTAPALAQTPPTAIVLVSADPFPAAVELIA